MMKLETGTASSGSVLRRNPVGLIDRGPGSSGSPEFIGVVHEWKTSYPPIPEERKRLNARNV